MSVILEAKALSRVIRGRDGGRRILNDVSLSLQEGETLGLIGPNGSGKSTLLHILAGLTRPDQGEVHLDGQPIHRHSRREIARRIAFVSQHAETGEQITVRDAVELGRTPWLGPLAPWGPEHETAVDDALQAVGMAAMADRDWTSLSGGERQRVHIARAHAQKPRLLLLDEPTNHLDIHHQLAILDLVAGLKISTIVALHDLHHATGCDRVLVLRKGHAITCGPPAQVLTPDLIREIFAVEAQLIPHPSGGRPVFAFQRLS